MSWRLTKKLSTKYYDDSGDSLESDDSLESGELETGDVSIMISSYKAGEFMVGEKC